MKVTVDDRELKRFSDNIGKILEGDKDAFMEACAKEIAARVLRSVKKRTPVQENFSYETKENGVKKTVNVGGGNLRNGWTASGQNSQGGGVDKGVRVMKLGRTYVVQITNNVLYAMYVEYGHRQNPGQYVPAIGKRLVSSWVPGKYMLTLSIKEVEAITPALLEKRMKTWLATEVFK